MSRKSLEDFEEWHDLTYILKIILDALQTNLWLGGRRETGYESVTK